MSVSARPIRERPPAYSSAADPDKRVRNDEILRRHEPADGSRGWNYRRLAKFYGIGPDMVKAALTEARWRRDHPATVTPPAATLTARLAADLRREYAPPPSPRTGTRPAPLAGRVGERYVRGLRPT